VRAQCAEVLGHPLHKIKVVPTEIGGGFGGKISIYLEPLAALLSKKTGKPVKIQMDRVDVFEGTGPTPGTSIRAKLGAKNDGTLRAFTADMAYENGAYPGTAANYATMVPSFLAPTFVFTQLAEVGPDASKTSSRVICIFTGLPVFFERSAARGSR
jgi:CO/xanthine dehydrogenase Mo-binding subunit